MNIQSTYHDAIHYASASFNFKEKFYLTGGEFRFLNKLIHYSTIQKNITWTSDQIGAHLFITPDAVDSLVKKLRAKGYITTSTTQISEKTKQRTIWINWKKFEDINEMVKKYHLTNASDMSEANIKEVTSMIEPEVIPQAQVEEIVPVIEEKQLINESIEFDLKPSTYREFWIEEYLENDYSADIINKVIKYTRDTQFISKSQLIKDLNTIITKKLYLQPKKNITDFDEIDNEITLTNITL